MSEETYKQVEESEENEENDESPPPVTVNPEGNQPRDLGIHKVVICPPDQVPESKGGKHAELMAECITIVQDEYCQWEMKSIEKSRGAWNKIVTTSALCLVFISLEFVGGYLSNSLVIAADAAQLLTVFSTLMASLFTLRLQTRGRDHIPLGWSRPEVMAALLSILTTWVLTSIVLYLAFQRLVQGDFSIDVDMMLATSAFGVVANLLMGIALHNNCYLRHPAVCDSDVSPVINQNVRAAFLHIVGDFLFTLSVFITALFIDCCPDWYIVDPICTVVFSLLVLFITLAILKDVLNLLVEEVPKGVFLSDVLKTFLNIEGVQQVQDIRIWAISIDKNALSAHLIIRPGVNHNVVLDVATRRIHAKYNFFEMAIHIEEMQEGACEKELELSNSKNPEEEDSGSVETLQCTDSIKKQ